MRSSTVSKALLASLLASPALAVYNIVENLNSSNFLSSFDFFTDADPTQGAVNYVSLPQAATAALAGFIPQQDNAIYLGVDSAPIAASGGNRSAIRLQSKKWYRHGLFAADIAHMPEGCGTWPAFWLVGANWPAGGEVDVLEGVNLQKDGNIMTLHTGPNCAMKNATGANKGYTGEMLHNDCDVNSPNQDKNVGCAVQDARPESYGHAFNTAGGGVFAVQWTSQAIKIWFFPRKAIPADLNSGAANVDPSGWGAPSAAFAGSDQCSIDNSFKDMQIVINTSLCGVWAGTDTEWNKNPECKKQAPTCAQYVAQNHGAFDNAYWAFSSIRTYNTSAAA